MFNEKVCSVCLSYMLDDILEGWLRCPSCSNMIKKEKSMITMKELLQNRAKFEELSEDLQSNGKDLLDKLNLFRKEYGKPMIVSSGYRPPAANAAAGGAKQSAHLTLQACDFSDKNNEIKDFIKKDPTVLERCGLYMEDPDSTLLWCHLQSRPTKSGNRIFKP